MNNKTYQISGMTCNHCKMHVQKAIEEINGVVRVDVNLETGEATVEMDDNVSDDAISQAVRDAGNYAVQRY
ncbi:MAG: heavy-metal-associated domain-containing protein [Flavobacteriales bacterium]|nr:heavy-metal-associated domain-containing protein [Flavobacteriales bacterium]